MESMKIHFDFETFSEANLRKVGTWKYASDPSTRVLCMAYAIDDAPPKLWVPDGNNPVPGFIRRMTNKIWREELHAWNSFFEWCIIALTLKLTPPPISQWHDTAAKAAALALPRALGNCGKALGMPENLSKDKRGGYLINQLCKPGKRNDDPVLLRELYDYCIQDVITERAINKKLLPLTKTERAIWELDQKINIHGVGIDMDKVNNALVIYEKTCEQLIFDLKNITALGNPNSHPQFLKWMQDSGFDVENTQAGTLQEFVKENEIPADKKKAIELKLTLAKTAPKKYNAFKERQVDNRIYGNIMYHGASTGRWASTGINLQNIARPSFDDIERCIDLFTYEDPEIIGMIYKNPIEALSSCVRGMLVPTKGKTFFIGDYSAIEARVLAWLAEQNDVLDIFRGHGKLYEHTASKIYQKHIDSITKDERFVGKVGTLACGYQGGAGALVGMAKIYKVDLTPERAELIKTEWRKANPKIVQYWKDIENAAIRAILSREQTSVRNIKFLVKHNFLFIQLPSGRLLAYNQPRVKSTKVVFFRSISTDEENPCSVMHIYNKKIHTPETFRSMAKKAGTEVDSFETPSIRFNGTNSQTRKWERQMTYGGKLVENITQAVARDIMAEGMLNLDKDGFDIVLTVHDEDIAERKNYKGALERFKFLMEVCPDWAPGLPIKVDAFTSKRYKKQ